MKRVGQVLKEARLKKKLSLADVERETKIRQSILADLEEGNYSKLPPPTFIKGLIKNYGEFLQLPTSHLLALFRREFSSVDNDFSQLKRLRGLKLLNIRLTPNFTVFSFAIFIVAVLFIYLIFQYISFSATPTLEVNFPTDSVVVNSDTFRIIGRTDPENLVTINNDKIETDENGNFATNLKLIPGENTIEIIAINKLGKTKKVVKKIQANFVPNTHY